MHEALVDEDFATKLIFSVEAKFHLYGKLSEIVKKKTCMETILSSSMLLLASAMVTCISIVTAIQLWFYKSTKRYDNIPPAYGTKNPLLLIWQLYQQIKIEENSSLASDLFKIASAFAAMFQREGIFFMWIGFEPHVGIYKAEYIREVINSKVADDKSKHYLCFRSYVGSGLITSSGDKHIRRRKLLQPALSSRILENYIARFNEHSLILVNNLKSLINEPWIDIMPVISSATLDIFCHTALNTDIGSQQGNHEVIKYLEAIDEGMDIIIERALRPWLSSDTIFYLTSMGQQFRKLKMIADDFPRKIINEGIESFNMTEECNECDQHSKRTSKSFLDLLLECHVKDSSFTLEDVQEEVKTILIAGHDTSTIAICWVLYLLGLHPDVQEKVYQEQCSVFGENKTAEATNEDTKNMSYLESVIKETLRLYPPAPIIARENKENIKIGSYTIPPRTQIAFLIYMLHRDPEVFPNPERFDPERFSSGNISKHDTFSYIPFSAGCRSCIGQRYAMMEMKILLSHVVRNFKITSLDPREKMKICMKVMLKCLNPMRLRLCLRP